MIRWVLFFVLIFVLLLARSEVKEDEKSKEDVQIYDNVTTIGYTRPPRLTHAQKIEIFFTIALVYVLAVLAIVGVCSFAYCFLRPEERVHEQPHGPPNRFEGAEFQRNGERIQLNRAPAPVVPGEY
ncbi:hypothetical protein B9Z55_021362 [Caenorhabditis nigoni]|uniref:Cytochrome c oxidase polypeptide II n=1 Tax=Caenorhabditis nigoni TaxID=1611254 RepID=A0A2G5TRT3_9PELO|nr:hypothetical protein B9Z55_021362 [Caenorhabditis nigoni]